MIYEYECQTCGREWEEFHSYQERNNEFCCGKRAVKLLARGVQTSDDLAWNFRAEYFGNRPVEIHSRKQYKKLLKQHGMADCTPLNAFTVKRKKDDIKERSVKMADNIRKKIHKEGLSESYKSFTKEVTTNGFKQNKEVGNG